MCLMSLLLPTVKVPVRCLSNTEGGTSDGEWESERTRLPQVTVRPRQETFPGPPFLDSRGRPVLGRTSGCRTLCDLEQLSVNSLEPSFRREGTRNSTDIGDGCKTNVEHSLGFDLVGDLVWV